MAAQKTGNKFARTFLIKFREKHLESRRQSAVMLLGLQVSLIFILLATLLLICFLNSGQRLVFYATLIVVLVTAILPAIYLNLKGRYKASAWITILVIGLGPWGSLLLDRAVSRVDFFPLLYIALSIQLCALLLSERATIATAFSQMVVLTVFMIRDAGMRSFNWPGMLAFIFISTIVGVITSFISRKQFEQIQRQNEKLREDEVQLRTLSIRDPLTGLYNRRHMEETLEKEVQRAMRQGRSLGLIMADIDSFKKVNDTYGHDVGDFILTNVAIVLRQKIRISDIACRFGGDEFVLILPDCTLQDACEKARALREELANVVFEDNGHSFEHIGLSLGAAALPESGGNARELMKAADIALYEAKKARELPTCPTTPDVI